MEHSFYLMTGIVMLQIQTFGKEELLMKYAKNIKSNIVMREVMVLAVKDLSFIVTYLYNF